MIIGRIASIAVTAAALKSIALQLVRCPLKVERLRGKVAANEEGRSARDSINIPYLQAFVMEALRLHPPAPFFMEKISPPHGDEVFLIPSHTRIG